jgi:kynurenine 3-monooxygenase
LALKEALEETSFNFQEALPLYSKRQANEARALVEMSRTFDHTGFRQFAQFIFPIIVDGIFHSQFPRLFRPNTIKFLQEDGFTFTQVRKRKYLDRAGQVLVTAGLVKGGWAAVRLALNVALKCL